MNYSLSYISDISGNRTSVVVPINVWEKITAENEMLQNKLNVFDTILKGMSEIKESKSNKTKLENLEDFLNEGWGQSYKWLQAISQTTFKKISIFKGGTIYDKSNTATISKNELKQLIKNAKNQI